MSVTIISGGIKYKDANNVEHTYDGLKGDPGSSPNLTVGTVSTLSPGSPATANITGTSPDLVLNLGIPRGATGTNSVTSVNGQTGTVVLEPSDINIVYSAFEPSSPVTGMIWLSPAT